MRNSASVRTGSQASNFPPTKTLQPATRPSTAVFKKYPIYISKAYLAWHNDWAKVQIGKTANPFYTTDLVWDPDITPSGLFETIDIGKLIAPDETGYAKGGYSKDGKSVAPAPSTVRGISCSMLGRCITATTSRAISNNDSSTDGLVFETQLVASYKFGNGIKATVAPGWFVENAASLTGFVRNNAFQDSTLVSGASRDLNILLAPGDVSFKLGTLPFKVLWDFAYNIEGRKRTEKHLSSRLARSEDRQRDSRPGRLRQAPQQSRRYGLPARLPDRPKQEGRRLVAARQLAANRHCRR